MQPVNTSVQILSPAIDRSGSRKDTWNPNEGNNEQVRGGQVAMGIYYC